VSGPDSPREGTDRLERLLAAAEAHGDAEGSAAEIGDLQGLLAAAYERIPEDRRAGFWADPRTSGVLEESPEFGAVEEEAGDLDGTLAAIVDPHPGVMTFEGRQVPDVPPPGFDVGPAPCVFCGRGVAHVNDGGVACVAGAVLDGEVRHFLYCNVGGCVGDRTTGEGRTRSEEDWDRLWTCGDCAVDCLSDECHECRKPRHLVDREILDPPDQDETRLRRWVVVASEGDVRTPESAVVVGRFHYVGVRGEGTRAVLRFACDAAAEAFRRLCPHETEAYERKSAALGAADEAIARLFHR